MYIHMGFPLMAVVELQDHNKAEVNGTQGRKGDDDGCKKCILNFLKLGNLALGKEESLAIDSPGTPLQLRSPTGDVAAEYLRFPRTSGLVVASQFLHALYWWHERAVYDRAHQGD